MAKNLTCPECGFIATAPQGLGAHRKHRHGVAGTSTGAVAYRAGHRAPSQMNGSHAPTAMERLEQASSRNASACPVCGKVISSKANMQRHVRDVHKGETGTLVNGHTAKALVAVTTAPVVARAKKRPGVMKVDDLATVVLTSIYPSGVPVIHLPTVFQWWQATDQLLALGHE